MLPPPRKVIFMLCVSHQKLRCRHAPASTLRQWPLQGHATCPSKVYQGGRPSACNRSESSRRRRNGRRCSMQSWCGAGMAIRPRSRSFGSTASACRQRRRSGQRDPALRCLATDIDLQADRQVGAVTPDAGRRGVARSRRRSTECTQSKGFGDQARLVGLQRTDEMPFKFQRTQFGDLRDAFPHIAFAKSPLASGGQLAPPGQRARSC
jgi:hypothetical protein